MAQVEREQVRPLVTGFLFGLGYWLTSVPWIQPTLATYGGLPTWLATVSLVLAAGYLAVYSALFATGQHEIRRSELQMLECGVPVVDQPDGPIRLCPAKRLAQAPERSVRRTHE